MMNKVRIKLTNGNIKNIEIRDKSYYVWDTELSGLALRVFPSGTMIFNLRYRIDGKQKYRKIGKFGDVTAAEARNIAKKLNGEVAQGIDVQEERRLARVKTQQEKSSTLGGFMEHKYIPWVEVERKSGKRTVALIRRNFKHLYSKPLTSVSKWDITKWRTEKAKTGTKPSTLNRATTAIKGVLSKALEWEQIEVNPLAGFKKLKEDTNPSVRYLTKDEEAKLRKALRQRDCLHKIERKSHNSWLAERGYSLLQDISSKTYSDHLEPMVLLAINTGMRKGEILSLRWKYIYLGSKTLTVIAQEAKSANTRHIPLSDEAYEVLSQWQRQSNGNSLVFPNENGERFDNIYKSWRNLLKKANIVDFRFHDLRHHFASTLAMSGVVDLNTLRELLGHADIKMTLRYAHLAPEHKAAAISVLNLKCSST